MLDRSTQFMTQSGRGKGSSGKGSSTGTRISNAAQKPFGTANYDRDGVPITSQDQFEDEVAHAINILQRDYAAGESIAVDEVKAFLDGRISNADFNERALEMSRNGRIELSGQTNSKADLSLGRDPIKNKFGGERHRMSNLTHRPLTPEPKEVMSRNNRRINSQSEFNRELRNYVSSQTSGTQRLADMHGVRDHFSGRVSRRNFNSYMLGSQNSGFRLSESSTPQIAANPALRRDMVKTSMGKLRAYVQIDS